MVKHSRPKTWQTRPCADLWVISVSLQFCYMCCWKCERRAAHARTLALTQVSAHTHTCSHHTQLRAHMLTSTQAHTPMHTCANAHAHAGAHTYTGVHAHTQQRDAVPGVPAVDGPPGGWPCPTCQARRVRAAMGQGVGSSPAPGAEPGAVGSSGWPPRLRLGPSPFTSALRMTVSSSSELSCSKSCTVSSCGWEVMFCSWDIGQRP